MNGVVICYSSLWRRICAHPWFYLPCLEVSQARFAQGCPCAYIIHFSPELEEKPNCNSTFGSTEIRPQGVCHLYVVFNVLILLISQMTAQVWHRFPFNGLSLPVGLVLTTISYQQETQAMYVGNTLVPVTRHTFGLINSKAV